MTITLQTLYIVKLRVDLYRDAPEYTMYFIDSFKAQAYMSTLTHATPYAPTSFAYIERGLAVTDTDLDNEVFLVSYDQVPAYAQVP